jgi:hypothetical protein
VHSCTLYKLALLEECSGSGWIKRMTAMSIDSALLRQNLSLGIWREWRVNKLVNVDGVGEKG